MKFKAIKAYNFFEFLNTKCKFMVSGISQIVVVGPISFEEVNIPGNYNNIKFNTEWRRYNYYITIQKPYASPPRKGAYGSMPHFVIPYSILENEQSLSSDRVVNQIITVEDFISIFHPAPTDIKFRINIAKRSRNLFDIPEAMSMKIKSVDFLKTCIRINV